tara:strand:+ start:12099 stop:12812 length:714 start_codon:yes stop_codon:yes gene_type:complete
MKLLPNIVAIDLAIKIKDNLIITDVHIGHEEALNRQGILVPRFQFKDIIQRLEKILSKTGKLDKIIINGDLKHEFGRISDQEWRNVLKLLDFLQKHCNKILITKGNHDPIIKPIADKRNIEIKEQFVLEKDILILHGNKIPENLEEYKTIIIGHEHPAISLKQGPRIELYKCYLVGKHKRKNLIVQPSLSQVTEGSDILRSKYLSPFLKKNLDNFSVFAVEDQIYSLGKVKEIKKLK